MRLLVHVCCAPCACDLLSEVFSGVHSLIPYWYNPNIHPWTEYEKRLASVRELTTALGLEPVVDDDYDLETFLQGVGDGSVPHRCSFCYQLRMDRTAERARELGADAFTTSLLSSPRQRHDEIRAAGNAAATGHSVPFLYHDFRPRYPRTITLSRQFGLYRQQYCGCIFSERDRYLRPSQNRRP